jgi:hypothetical protein
LKEIEEDRQLAVQLGATKINVEKRKDKKTMRGVSDKGRLRNADSFIYS